MKGWHQAVVPATASIRDAIQAIDRGVLQVAFVVDEHNRLLGLVTDGDIRRGILRGIGLEESVRLVMNASPVTVPTGTARDEIMALMRRKRIRHIPIVNENREIADVALAEELVGQPTYDNWVVLMAGGEGRRLRPLTEDVPKPLLRIGSKPLLEIILNSFISQGFHRFFISINYKAEMIEKYFGDGSAWGVDVEYLREKAKLGTAGSLSLLPGQPDDSIIVMNGDLLTNMSFGRLLEFHEETRAAATVCIREHHVSIPYGVVETDKNRLTALVEKPIRRFFVNAGIYVLNPDVLQLVKPDTYTDMTDLVQRLLKRNDTISTYPIHEYWSDIGRPEDFQRAQEEAAAVFEDD